MADLRDHTGELGGNSRITLSRREFLKLTGASAAPVALGGGFGWLLSSCSNGPTTTTAALPATTTGLPVTTTAAFPTTTVLPTTISGAGRLYPVSVDGKWGYIDKTGALVVKPQFDSANRFSEGLGVVAITENGVQKSGYIDSSGRMVIQPQFDVAEDFTEGLAAAGITKGGGTSQGFIGFIDKSGRFVIPAQYTHSRGFSEGLCAAIKPGERGWGYIDKTGAMVIKPHFDDVQQFSEGLAGVNIGGVRSYIDQKGNPAVKLPPGMLAGSNFSEGLAAVLDAAGQLGYIDKTGAVVMKPKFEISSEWGIEFHGGLAAVGITKNGATKFGYIDKTGLWVIPPQFDEAAAFSEGLAAVGTLIPGGQSSSSNDYVSDFIDRTGKVVIKLRQGQEVGAWPWSGFTGGVARCDVFTDIGDLVPDSTTYVDASGKVIWQGKSQGQ